MTAILALRDGRVFEGESFGAAGTAVGEVCFNTSMTGYQEVLTDPSYRGQIVTMTYPLIGNTGITKLDMESLQPHVRGFVIGELSPVVSNWRATGSLDEFLKMHGVAGIEAIDTRALTRHLRSLGAMNGCLTTELSEGEAIERAAACASMEGADYVREVSPDEAYDWDGAGALSRRWRVVQGGEDFKGDVLDEVPAAKNRIVALDFGAKQNILRRLRQTGLDVHVLPSTATAEDILELKPDGIFLSNGPGDPAALTYAHETVRKVVREAPLFGICLGHQILAYALGGKTFKLKFGHRGGNQPVKDLRTGRVAITSQNHGFAVDPGSLPPEVEVTHINLNDGTVAGLRHRELPAFSVQYHPEASPGPHDASDFFEEFAQAVATASDR